MCRNNRHEGPHLDLVRAASTDRAEGDLIEGERRAIGYGDRRDRCLKVGVCGCEEPPPSAERRALPPAGAHLICFSESVGVVPRVLRRALVNRVTLEQVVVGQVANLG